MVGVAPLAGAWVEIYRKSTEAQWTQSLPSRERGLKYGEKALWRCGLWSLPSRERGLKLKEIRRVEKIIQSLPSRERGLKYRRKLQVRPSSHVAPLAGAWVEILISG